MNEMPDLPLDKKFDEQRKVIKFWIDRCHYLEKLLDEQKRIIADAGKQIRLLQSDSILGPAPRGSLCSCCDLVATVISVCGHYFCNDCFEKGHSKDCIACLDYV
jgi:hypothetical protein